MSEADLTGVLSADREERNRATARIEALCADKPDEATAFLAASLRGSPQVREVASLLLYTKLLCNAKNMAAIRPETLAQLVNAVTELVGDAQGAIPSLLLKRLAEIMMQISLKTSSPKDGLARIFQLDAAVANVNLFQLYALQVFCEFNIAQEEGGLESACGTLVAFLERNLKSESLEAESEGLLFIFTELVETKEIPDSLRVAASQLLVLIAQKNTARVKKAAGLADKVLPTLVRLVALHQSEALEEPLTQRRNQILFSAAPAEGTSDLRRALLEALAEIGNALGPKSALPLIMPLVHECLRSPDWKVSSSGLEILALLLENAGSTFAGQENVLSDMVAPFVTSTNHKVVYTALGLITVLAREFTPGFQTSQHQRLLPVVLNILADESQPRALRLKATTALAEIFSEDLLTHIAEPEDDQEAQQMSAISQAFGDRLTQLVIETFIRQSAQ